jgi:hypothetical protein
VLDEARLNVKIRPSEEPVMAPHAFERLNDPARASRSTGSSHAVTARRTRGRNLRKIIVIMRAAGLEPTTFGSGGGIRITSVRQSALVLL